MKIVALALVALLAPGQPVGSDAPGPASRELPSGPVEVDGHPLRLAALAAADGGVEVLLLGERDLERFRLVGRRLARRGAFHAPVKRARPLLLDAARSPDGEPLVAVTFGEDVQSVDEGTDTRLHSWILSVAPDGALHPASEDLEAYVRLVGGEARAQRRAPHRLHDGPVLAVEADRGLHHVGEAAVPWASRWLLAATPLPGGVQALAWEDGRPLLVSLEDGARIPGGSLLGDLGTVREPQIAVRLERPVFALGMDKEGRKNDEWHPVPRRVAIGPDGAAYTIERGRAPGLPIFGRTTGQDTVVRLEASSDGGLSVARPFPGVDAYVLDFALLERPGREPGAVLLVNDAADGSGRAHLLFQGPR